jgi:hypothetical protein
MKKVMLVSMLAVVVLGTSGCASFTKGVETARGTVIGAIDTVKSAVDSGFSVVGKAAGAAEKIADAANAGVKETVSPVVENPATP